MTDQTLYQAALRYLDVFGFSVIPLRPNKKPRIDPWKPYQRKKASPDEIRQWWTKWPSAMIGIVTGSLSGVEVIDIDTEKGKEAIAQYIPESIVTPTCRTPREGQHLYFKCPDPPLRNNKGMIPGCDFRGEGGYVCAPPSRTGVGKAYEWLDGLSIEEVDLAELPEPYIKKIVSISNREKKKTTETTKPPANPAITEPYVPYFWKILNGPAWRTLPASAGKALPLFLGKVKRPYSDPQRYEIKFDFSYKEGLRFGFAFATFSRVIQSLVRVGFIDPVCRGGKRSEGKSNSLFKLSKRWEAYDTDSFEEVEWSCFTPKTREGAQLQEVNS